MNMTSKKKKYVRKRPPAVLPTLTTRKILYEAVGTNNVRVGVKAGRAVSEQAEHFVRELTALALRQREKRGGEGPLTADDVTRACLSDESCRFVRGYLPSEAVRSVRDDDVRAGVAPLDNDDDNGVDRVSALAAVSSVGVRMQALISSLGSGDGASSEGVPADAPPPAAGAGGTGQTVQARVGRARTRRTRKRRRAPLIHVEPLTDEMRERSRLLDRAFDAALSPARPPRTRPRRQRVPRRVPLTLVQPLVTEPVEAPEYVSDVPTPHTPVLSMSPPELTEFNRVLEYEDLSSGEEVETAARARSAHFGTLSELLDRDDGDAYFTAVSPHSMQDDGVMTFAYEPQFDDPRDARVFFHDDVLSSDTPDSELDDEFLTPLVDVLDGGY